MRRGELERGKSCAKFAKTVSVRRSNLVAFMATNGGDGREAVDPRRTTSLNSAAWRASERASEREKRDGKTARILFAIKARDNLKAITITHGLGVYAVRWLTAASPAPRRDRGHALSSPLGSFCDFHAANRSPLRSKFFRFRVVNENALSISRNSPR